MKLLFYIFITLFFFSCATTKETSNNSENNSVVFTFQKTSCFGKCPVFSMTIEGHTHTITYIGKYNVEKIGEYKKSITDKEISSLKEAFENAHFFDFEDKYTKLVSDFPTTYIGYSINGKTKNIEDYFGAPAELKKLESLLEKISISDGWKKIKDIEN